MAVSPASSSAASASSAGISLPASSTPTTGSSGSPIPSPPIASAAIPLSPKLSVPAGLRMSPSMYGMRRNSVEVLPVRLALRFFCLGFCSVGFLVSNLEICGSEVKITVRIEANRYVYFSRLQMIVLVWTNSDDLRSACG